MIKCYSHLTISGNHCYCKPVTYYKYIKSLGCIGVSKAGVKHCSHIETFHWIAPRYAGQEATVGTGHGTTDWFQIGKRVHQGCVLSPCLFNLYAEYIMRNAGLEEAQAGIKIAGRNINNLRYAETPPLWQKVKRN